MKFSKDNIKRGMAGGLIALMIASNVACDKKESSVNDWLEAQKIGDVNVMDITGYNDDAIPREWDAYDNLNLQPLPLSFFNKLGIVEKKNGGTYLKEEYTLAEASAYADTNKNKINLIVRVAESIHMRQYHLQYDVSDDDLQTFLDLDDDFRMRFFIQGLDASRKRKVVNELDLCMYYRDGGGIADGYFLGNGFSYVDDIDIKNKTITYVYEPAKTGTLLKCKFSLADATMIEDDWGNYLAYPNTPMEQIGDIQEVASTSAGTFVPVSINGTQINENVELTPKS